MEHTTRTERVCRTCPGLGRDGTDGRPAPNYYDYRWSCEECRPQLHGILNRIPHTFINLDATPGNGHREHVSGTIEAPLGVRTAVLDQIHTGPTIALAYPPLPTGPDQEGVLPAQRVLRHIAGAWLPTRQAAYPWERLPRPATVKQLAAWLEARVDWACNTLPESIGDHVGYLSALAHRLDRLVDPGTNRPEPIEGVVCRECDRYSLARHKGEIVCTANGCNVRMDLDEYHRWVGLNAALAKH